MKDEDALLGEETLDEDLLDFEFDDLLAGDIEATNGDSIPDEEVIELVDVVEEDSMPGDLEADSGLEDLSITTDEGGPTDGDEPETVSENFTLTMDTDDFLKELDDGASDLALKLESDSDNIIDDLESFTEPDLELDLEGSDLESLAGEETELEDLIEAEDVEEGVEPDLPESDDFSETPDSESDTVLKGQDIPEEPDAEPDIQDSDLEAMAQEMPSIETEDPAKAPVSDDQPAEETRVQEEEKSITEMDLSPSQAVEAAVTAPASVKPQLEISQDRIETIIKEVVEEVVERVARETMADVAKKVIGEAIDALKKSLESPSEQ